MLAPPPGTVACYATTTPDGSKDDGDGDGQGAVMVAAEATRSIASAEGMEAVGAALWEAGVGPGHTILLYG